MSEKTVEIEIPLLLPDVEDQDDDCLVRLETAFENQKGITRAHLERDKSPVNLCLHYEPDLISIEKVKRIAERAGAQITDRFRHQLLPVEGMDCSDCVTVIEHSLARMDGVLAVNVSYVFQNLRIEYDNQKVKRPEIEKRIRSLGYDIPAEGMLSWYQENQEVLFSLVAGLFVLIGWLGQTFFGLNEMFATGFFIAAYLFGGWEISHHAWHALRERHFDTDLLMVMAAIGAASLGEWAEGALLLFLFSLGHALEERALDHARSAVRALADLTPKTALIKRDDREIELPVEQVTLEDVVIVRPGVRIPVDGKVLFGESAVDQSPVTGESIPVDKTPGSKVFAGTINGASALEIRTTRLAKDSTLARVMKLVEEAQTQKSPTQQITEKFSSIFVPLVLGVDLLLIVIPPLFGVPFRESFLRAMTLLVAASPCALALGTPSAILAAIAQAARHGVLIKGGAFLENLGRIKAIAFDKTGTITIGKPELTDLLPLGELSADEVLALAAAVENRSAHPLGQAVVQAAKTRQLKLPAVMDVTSITGRGIQALVDERMVRVGNANLFDEQGISIPEDILNSIQEFENQGKTAMLVYQEDKLVGLIAVADVLRPDAPVTVSNLKAMGVSKMVMLTGDNDRVAAHIAGQVGLGETHSNLLPEDKLVVIRSLIKDHGEVAMVGDGVNDAPALANSTVGIAMGGAGTDIALETADVALMGDDLSKLPFAVGLSRAARRVIVQNLTIALGVIATLVVASVTGLVGIGLAVIFHEGSTIVVVLNSLRLLGYQSKV